MSVFKWINCMLFSEILFSPNSDWDLSLPQKSGFVRFYSSSKPNISPFQT